MAWNKRSKKTVGLPLVFRRVAGKAKLLTLGLVLLIAASVVMALLPPLALEVVINRLTGGQGVSLGLAFLYFGLIAASGLLDAGKEGLITVYGQKITRELRTELCDKLSRMPAAYFTSHEAGTVTSRFVSDVDTVETLFSDGIVGMMADACKIVGILGIIFAKSRGLGILLLLVTPLLFIMTRLFQRRMLSAQMDNRVAVAKVNNHVPETISNLRMIRSFAKEQYMEQRYDDHIQESYRAMERVNLYDSIYSPIVLTVSAAIVAIMMICSAAGGEWQSLFGMSIGTAVAIIAYVGKVFEPLESIGMEIQSIQSAVAGVYRINSFLREPERPQPDEAIRLDDLRRSDAPVISLDKVCFSYDANQPVLRQLSLSVEKGECVTLAGRTGAGKSTVFRLLLGLYAPDSGSVRVCGAAAHRIPDGVKRDLFGYVEQTFHAVPGNIRDQIALFDRRFTQNQIEQAASLVGLDATIQQLEQGYDTPFQESLFSQGQLQLLAVARAIVPDPMILLLDEITANLDTETEQRVLEALERASQNRTVISISHRLYERSGGRLIMIS